VFVAVEAEVVEAPEDLPLLITAAIAATVMIITMTTAAA
jgi:hypothetical protein